MSGSGNDITLASILTAAMLSPDGYSRALKGKCHFRDESV